MIKTISIKRKERTKLPNPNLPPYLGKLLIFGERDNNYLAYKLGQEGIYLDRVIELETSTNTKALPKIAIIRYELDSEITKFIKKSGITTSRIFKTANFRTKARTRAYFYNAVNNILGLAQKLKRKTLRIKSKHPKLRKEFYNICMKVNKEGKFRRTFDYDNWDVLIEIRKYNVGKQTWMVITSEGLDSLLSDTDHPKVHG